MNTSRLIVSDTVLTLQDYRRKIKSKLMIGLLLLSVIAVLSPLVAIFVHVISSGVKGLNLDLFTALPKPVGEKGGGLSNAFLGSLMLVGMAGLVGIPWGVGLGVFMSEYRHSRIVPLLRTVIDVLGSIPSIIIGLFAYALLVIPFKTFSALAGSFALTVLILPLIARTTEEVLKLMPDHFREAGLALGIPRWRVILSVVVKGNMPGIFTGVILGIARILGETAPLLFTAFGNRVFSKSLFEPIASLPVQIYNYAISPYEEWHAQAWAAALVLIVFIFLFNLCIRVLISKRGES